MVGIIVLLLAVGLSGCLESEINDNEEFKQWLEEKNEFFSNMNNLITNTAENYLSGIYSVDTYYEKLEMFGRAQKVYTEGCINQIENFTLSGKWNAVSVPYLEFLIDSYWTGYYYELGGKNKSDYNIGLGAKYTQKAGEHLMEVNELLD